MLGGQIKTPEEVSWGSAAEQPLTWTPLHTHTHSARLKKKKTPGQTRITGRATKLPVGLGSFPLWTERSGVAAILEYKKHVKWSTEASDTDWGDLNRSGRSWCVQRRLVVSSPTNQLTRLFLCNLEILDNKPLIISPQRVTESAFRNAPVTVIICDGLRNRIFKNVS